MQRQRFGTYFLYWPSNKLVQVNVSILVGDWKFVLSPKSKLDNTFVILLFENVALKMLYVVIKKYHIVLQMVFRPPTRYLYR